MTDSLISHADHKNIAVEDQFHLAKRYHALLEDRVAAFKKKIGDNEVGACVPGLGEYGLFYLDELHHADPSLIAICGTTVEGEPIEIIQEVSHINIVLKVLPERHFR